jgi:hypothetical protein
MSLSKPLKMSPARIEANRRNAQKPTGPRTPRGKAQVRMNALRQGSRSPLYHNLIRTLLCAPPSAVDRTAGAVLTPEQSAHPLLADLVQLFRQAKTGIAPETRQVVQSQGASKKKNSLFDDQSH